MLKNQSQIKSDCIKVADGLINAKASILEILDNENHGHTRLFVESRLNQIINRLNFQAGRSQNEGMSITSVLTPIIVEKKPEEVKKELSADEQRRANFIARIEQLIADLPTLSDEQVVEDYPLDADKLVIRGVAKRAGLEHFRTAEISSKFIAEIRAGLVEMEKLNEETEEKELVIANSENDDLTK